MQESFWFWFAKPLAELAWFAVWIGVIVAVIAITSIPRWRRQSRCPHFGVHEDYSCMAFCATCGKSLGFIGAWLEEHPESRRL